MNIGRGVLLELSDDFSGRDGDVIVPVETIVGLSGAAD